MNEQVEQNEYVTSKEGAEILGMKRTAFFNLAKTKQVAVLPGRGPRDNRYRLADILRVKKRREQEKQRRPYKTRTKPVDIDWLYSDDIPACLNLDKIVYHQMYLAEAAQYQSWVTKNPQIAMAAYDKKDRGICLAYVSILPLPEHIILDVLRRQRDELSIQANEIETYEQTGGYTLLANSAVVHPDRPDLLLKVLRKIIDHWIERFPERYITRIYAQSVTPKGDRMVSHFFMSPRYDLDDNAYMLDMARPGRSRLIQWFQDELQKKGNLPIGLQHKYEITPITPNPSTTISDIVTQETTPRAPRNKNVSTGNLPSDYVAFTDMARQHNVNDNTVRSDMRDGKIAVRRGHWNHNGKMLLLAFTPEQHRTFWEKYHNKTGFIRCNNCPHE